MICNSRSVFKFNFATIELFHISLFSFLLSLNLVMNAVSLIIPTSLDQFEQVLTLSDNFGQFRTSLDKFGQFWASMDKFGQVWTSLDKFGQV